ncbi:hypothetical protein JXR93_10220 [bacterium]|nr:hypothetical protein [bacterium]
MTNLRATEDKFIFKAPLIIENSLNDQTIKSLVDEYGYDEEKLNYGAELLDNLKKAQLTKNEDGSEFIEKKNQYDRAFNDAFNLYMDYVKISRVAFRENDQVISLLGINGLRKKNPDEFLKQAEMFYSGALKSDIVKSELLKFKITEEKLQNGLNLVKDFVKLYQEVSIERAETIGFTKNKNM